MSKPRTEPDSYLLAGRCVSTTGKKPGTKAAHRWIRTGRKLTMLLRAAGG